MDILTILPVFGGVLSTLVAFVVALSVIVAVHEYGHYIVGRWSGIKAEVFSLGFGPVLFSRMDRHGTRWQVAALPFGGYVKFLGDANATSVGGDEETYARLSEENKRHTMQGAPLWARSATVAAGPVFNFAFSIMVFTAVGLTTGVAKQPLTVGEVNKVPYEVALQPGDQIVAIAGQKVPTIGEGSLNEFLRDLPMQPTLDYQVIRDGQEITLNTAHPSPVVIAQMSPQSAAYDIDLKIGDVITQVDGQDILAFQQLQQAVLEAEGKPLTLKVWRDGAEMEFVLSPRAVDEPQQDGGFKTIWRIGIVGDMLFSPATEAPSLQDAVVAGMAMTWEIISGSFSGLYHMAKGDISTCNMSGPLGIAQVSGAMASQGVDSFIYFIGVLSTAVGLLNLFPIPVLDGGHLVFYAYEAVTRRPPSEKAMKILMTAGLTIILSLMLFALTNDLFCP